MKGKHVLVTGGAGSFGRHFVERILADEQPEKITVFSRDPHKHDLMRRMFQGAPIRYVIGDVRDRQSLTQACEGVDVVVHAAALKHVDRIEDCPEEAVKTNILGTANAIDAALEQEVERFVLLSTDKAVAPANTYGATKLIGESLVTNASSLPFCVCTVVRYGNVMSSAGSVLPHWMQLKRDGERSLPVTHEDMTRFWLSYRDAVDAVLIALRAPSGTTIIHKAPSFRLIDLAEAVGLPPKQVGRRPGEKLHEVLVHDGERSRCMDSGRYLELLPPGHWPLRIIERPYTSDTNGEWLSVEDIEARIEDLVQAGDL